MDRRPVVLITEPIAEVGLRLLDQSCQVRAPWTQGQTSTVEDLRVADAIIVRLVAVDQSLLSIAVNLKVIGRHGSGLDNVDLTAATMRRIPVVFTPVANANAVAEHTVHLMLASARHTLAADKAVREARFGDRDFLVGFELREKTLGVVGLGAVGSRVAEICRNGFKMRVVVFDPYAEKCPSRDSIVFVDSLRNLLEQADVVTLHVPLTPGTSHTINGQTLAWMKPSSLLINTSRGAVVDTLALADALTRGQILGAAIDVFENEPLDPAHPLLSAPRTVFSPHIAGSTWEAREEMSELVARQVLEVLRGGHPQYVANPQVLSCGRTPEGR